MSVIVFIIIFLNVFKITILINLNKKNTIEFKKIIISEKKRYKDILIYNIRKNAPKKSI